MYKNLKTPAERKLPHVQDTFSCKTTFFKMDPSARKMQESGSKQNKSKKINRTLKLEPWASKPARHCFEGLDMQRNE